MKDPLQKLHKVENMQYHLIDPGSGQLNANPRKYISLQLDLIGTILSELSSMSPYSVKYHLMNPKFQQILLTGDISQIYKSLFNPRGLVLDESKLRYHEQVILTAEKEEVTEAFMGGCVYRTHEGDEKLQAFVELIYLVINPSLHRIGLGKIMISLLQNQLHQNFDTIVTWADNRAIKFFEK